MTEPMDVNGLLAVTGVMSAIAEKDTHVGGAYRL
jgi:hypothetical protein